ncbi:hypothetical protein M422DRAFT_241577 [Sphaerobolus stellatus SS14]|nr:hypothetical protein M422DRAFT_241577 [Sphaerobolus stellatus SS14]
MTTFKTDPELELLSGEFNYQDVLHLPRDLENAPLFTGDALKIAGDDNFPQRAVFGGIVSMSDGRRTHSPKLYINVNTPFSGILCGVQGSGKSYSMSVILENCLIKDARLGTLPEPLSGLVFHFDSAAGTREPMPCEAAYIASINNDLGGLAIPPKVTVLVLPSSLEMMRKTYAKFPNVTVNSLRFTSEDLTAERLLSLMKVDNGNMPLYMESIISLMRSMPNFAYSKFRKQLDSEKFSPAQRSMLNIRLKILDSCLEQGNQFNCVSVQFQKGQLTIVDLTSPFMDSISACSYFDIILWLFIEAEINGAGKLVVLDEAHKYLTMNRSSRLEDSLLSVVRQQRHMGTRIVISTQEPTIVSPKFLDLCSFIIAHRVSSPKWLDHFKAHICVSGTDWFEKIMALNTGEALIFAPSALTTRLVTAENPTSEKLGRLGTDYFHVRSRQRITEDGGRSLVVVPILRGNM